MNKPITSKENESANQNLPTNKISEPDSFSGELYQTKKNI